MKACLLSDLLDASPLSARRLDEALMVAAPAALARCGRPGGPRTALELRQCLTAALPWVLRLGIVELVLAAARGQADGAWPARLRIVRRPRFDWLVPEGSASALLELQAGLRLAQPGSVLTKQGQGLAGMRDLAWTAGLELGLRDAAGAADVARFHAVDTEIHLPPGPWGFP